MYILYLIVLLSIGTVYSDDYDDVPVTKNSKWYSDTEKFAEWSKNRYQIVGTTTRYGDLCIDNCVNGMCSTGLNHKDKFPCKVVEQLRNVTAPVYFTTSGEKNNHVCLTRCGKYGERYEWCLVDKENNWDYCSTEIYKRKYELQLTTDGEYCTDRCKRSIKVLYKYGRKYILDPDGFYCKTALDQYKECIGHIFVDFVPARTIYGDICMGQCKRYRKSPTSSWSYRCYDIHKKYTACAPPAQEFGSHIEDIFYELYRKDIFEYEIPYN